VPALSGFRWDGVSRRMSFASAPGRWFWSNGSAWGTCEVTPHACGIEVIEGGLDLASLTFGDGPNILASPVHLSAGESIRRSR